jgi:hypothetical protein
MSQIVLSLEMRTDPVNATAIAGVGLRSRNHYPNSRYHYQTQERLRGDTLDVEVLGVAAMDDGYVRSREEPATAWIRIPEAFLSGGGTGLIRFRYANAIDEYRVVVGEVGEECVALQPVQHEIRLQFTVPPPLPERAAWREQCSAERAHSPSGDWDEAGRVGSEGE